MLRRFSLSLTLSALFCASAHAGCDPVRFGYLDQHRPPYWLGQGSEIPARPGASVELVRRFTASVGCPVELKRLPVLRIRPALILGEIDFAPTDAGAEKTAGIAFPRDKNNKLDAERSVPLNIVMFVRASDQIARDTDPFSYFQGKVVGTTLGSAYADRLRQKGMEVDTGATNVARNFEKLRQQRIAGFVVSVISPNDMDAYVAAKYGGQIVRLQQVLFSDHIWLAANQHYYDTHRAQVEAMWNWLGGPGKREFAALLDKYAGQQ